MIDNLTPHLKSWLEQAIDLPKESSLQEARAALVKAIAQGKVTTEQFEAAAKEARSLGIGDALRKAVAEGRIQTETLVEIATENKDGDHMADNKTAPTGKQIMGGARTKAASEEYSKTKSYAKHARTGAPAFRNGAQVETPSTLEYAKLGAFFKWRAARDRVGDVLLTEHDNQLVEEIFETDRWVGEIGGQSCEKMAPAHIKAALLGDTTSGGSYATPYFLDEMFATASILTGELAPYVNNIEMSQGTTVQGASAGTPQVHWDQQAEGTAITLEDMTGFIGQMNSSVHRVTGAYEFGRNLLQDTPLAIGQEISTQLNLQLAYELDRVVALGNGTTEPQGIFNASGLTTVNSINGAAGPLCVGDLESLMFAVPKQYRTAAWRPCFLSSDLTYARVRGIPNGSDDARRVFGMDEGSYTVLDWPYRVQQSITAGYLAYGALASYRLYRRSGAEVRFTDQGQTLALKNTALITVQARYAGRATVGSAFATMLDGSSVG